MHGVTSTTYTAETLRKIVPSTFKPQQNCHLLLTSAVELYIWRVRFSENPMGEKSCVSLLKKRLLRMI